MLNILFSFILEVNNWIISFLPAANPDVVWEIQHGGQTFVEKFAVGSQFFPVETLAILLIYMLNIELVIFTVKIVMMVAKKTRISG